VYRDLNILGSFSAALLWKQSYMKAFQWYTYTHGRNPLKRFQVLHFLKTPVCCEKK
jgi:hypothetical protein